MQTLTEIYELAKVVFILLLFVAVMAVIATLILNKLLKEPIRQDEEENEELF